jgi:hypothetical protein
MTDIGRVIEAIAAYRRAVALNPDMPEAWLNLGNALKEGGQLDEAVAAYRRAVAVKPGYALGHSNLGYLLREKGRLDEAVAACRQAIEIDPEHSGAHSNLALALLVQGHFAEGWEAYEWRWKAEGFGTAARDFGRPRWDGGALEGRTVLLHAEQGLGDALQFIRYLPLVQERGGKAIIECQPALQRLFGTMAGDVPVIAKGAALPAFDVHCPLLSLPRIFATDLANMPGDVPYLRADAAEASAWSDRLAAHPPGFRVGLVWAGNPNHTNDRNRSLKPASLLPLGAVKGVRFFSLQKGTGAEGRDGLPAGLELSDVAGELGDFADTAALIANLDLVITADTATAHLAGAMGRPVWTLLPFAPDWRWLLGREDSPWYPTMRLFRQAAIGDWPPVIARVCDQLRRLARSRGEA